MMGALLKALLSAVVQTGASKGFSLSRSGIISAASSVATIGLSTGNIPLAAIGGAVAAAAAIWGAFSHTDAANVAAVAALPGPAKQLAFAGIPDQLKLAGVSDDAKIAAVEAIPTVARILPKRDAPPDSAVMIAAADPDRPKVQVSATMPIGARAASL